MFSLKDQQYVRARIHDEASKPFHAFDTNRERGKVCRVATLMLLSAFLLILMSACASSQSVPSSTAPTKVTETSAVRTPTSAPTFQSSSTGLQWSGWQAVPGGVTTDVAVTASVFREQIYLFRKNSKSQRMDITHFSGTSWSGWQEIPGGGITSQAITATSYRADDARK